MLLLVTAILVGLVTLGCTQNIDDKVQGRALHDEDGSQLKLFKRSSGCADSEWQGTGSDSEKRSWGNMQAAWGKRKWQDMRNSGWGKRSPASSEFGRNIQSNLQTSFQEDKRGWKDMQGSSWGKRGWQDMRQQSWGKRGWNDMRSSVWGKRGLPDLRGIWGTRGWHDIHGLTWPGYGKRKWQDLQGSSWGKRGWKELKTSGWGKRSDDSTEDKRGWGDMKISGYGKRAWNDIQSSGWGKRGWKEMQSTGWGKRMAPDQENNDEHGHDWNLPLRPDILPEDSSGQPGEKLFTNHNDRWLVEPLDPILLYKLLEGLQRSSWINYSRNLKKIQEEDVATPAVERNP